jgi:hypothetical protein
MLLTFAYQFQVSSKSEKLQALFVKNYMPLCTILITEVKSVSCAVRDEAEETVYDLNITFEPNRL